MIWKTAKRFLPTMGAQAPIEGGSGKAVGFAAWGKAFPRLIILFLVDDRILILKH
jgi:hypothetical protein